MSEQGQRIATILISSASVGFANLIADLLRRDPGVTDVVIPTNRDEMFAALEDQQFDLHLVGGASVDFLRSVRTEALQGQRVLHRSREVSLMLNEPDPYRVLVARSWNYERVIDMRLPLEDIVERMLAPRGSSLWHEDEIGRFHIGEGANRPTLNDICRDEIDATIIEGIIEGLSDPEIADRINYAVQSVRNRVSRILMASQSRNRTHFAVRMVRSSPVRRTGT